MDETGGKGFTNCIFVGNLIWTAILQEFLQCFRNPENPHVYICTMDSYMIADSLKTVEMFKTRKVHLIKTIESYKTILDDLEDFNMTRVEKHVGEIHILHPYSKKTVSY